MNSQEYLRNLYADEPERRRKMANVGRVILAYLVFVTTAAAAIFEICMP